MEYYPERIIWHHTGDLSTGHQAEAVNRYHKSKNFPKSQLGFYGGYHLLIEKDGFVKRYRRDTELGAHTYGQNENSLGICMSGNFSLEQPTKEQIKSFKQIVQEKMSKYDIPVSKIYPHRKFRSTQCPGLLLNDDWAVNLVKKNILTFPQQFIISFIRCLIKSLNAAQRR